MPKRPAAFEVSPARVRVKRGPDKTGRWYWRADRPDGRGGRIDVWTGWGTKAEAAEAVRAALADPEAADAAAEIETIGDLLDCWLASVRRERRDAADRTRIAIETAIGRLLRHGLRDAPIQGFGREALIDYVNARRDDGSAGSTIQRDLKYLRQAWRWGQELDPPEVPLRRLPSIPLQRQDRKPAYTRYTPTAADVAGLLQGVPDRPRRALILMAATGCRIGEALGLTWGSVALDARRLVVDGKTGERVLDVPDVVAAEIRTWERGRPEEPVVGVSSNTIRKHLARRSRELGIGRCSPNSLRRHVVDALYLAAAADPKAAAVQLGHSEATAFEHYRTVRDEQRRRVVESAELGVAIDLAQRLAQRSQEGDRIRMESTPKGRRNPEET